MSLYYKGIKPGYQRSHIIELAQVKQNIPRTAKLFQLTFAARGGVVATPWILVFPTEFLREIFHGYSFGVKKSKGDS